jgi:hypothetical protein
MQALLALEKARFAVHCYFMQLQLDGNYIS